MSNQAFKRVLALHLAGFDDVVEQLPRAADERLALRVFIRAGRFADEQ